MAQSNPNAPCHNRLLSSVYSPYIDMGCVWRGEGEGVGSLLRYDWQGWDDSLLYWARYSARVCVRGARENPSVWLSGGVSWPRISPVERPVLLTPATLTRNVCVWGEPLFDYYISPIFLTVLLGSVYRLYLKLYTPSLATLMGTSVPLAHSLDNSIS